MLSKSIVDIEATSGSRVISGNAGGPQQREYGTTYSTGGLKKITYPGTGNYSQFSYDGLGRNVEIVEYSGSSISSTKQFVWCGSKRCEARNASSTIVAQYFTLGQSLSGASYCYTRDHLGSVREFMNSSGSIEAQLAYDPFGCVRQIQGTSFPDFQYAGYYEHSPSALNLTRTRAYSGTQGRFINRDLLGELGGVNLYSYVMNSPTNSRDPLGLIPAVLPPPNDNNGKPCEAARNHIGWCRWYCSMYGDMFYETGWTASPYKSCVQHCTDSYAPPHKSPGFDIGKNPYYNTDFPPADGGYSWYKYGLGNPFFSNNPGGGPTGPYDFGSGPGMFTD